MSDLSEDDIESRRLKSCVDVWPEASSGDYNPSCCRFPKSCSPHGYIEAVRAGNLKEEHLEPKRANSMTNEHITSEKESNYSWMPLFIDGMLVGQMYIAKDGVITGSLDPKLISEINQIYLENKVSIEMKVLGVVKIPIEKAYHRFQNYFYSGISSETRKAFSVTAYMSGTDQIEETRWVNGTTTRRIRSMLSYSDEWRDMSEDEVV